LQEVDQVEQINKQYWYACQRYIEMRTMERSNGDRNNPVSSAAAGSLRFREIMLCLPEIRHVAGRMVNSDVTKLPLLFKVRLILKHYHHRVNLEDVYFFAFQ